MKNKFIMLICCMMIGLILSSCSPHKTHIRSVSGFGRDLELAIKNFEADYKSRSEFLRLKVKDVYGTYYIPEMLKYDTLNEKLVSKYQDNDIIQVFSWDYGVHTNNGDFFYGSSQYITSNAVGNIGYDYYYSFLTLGLKYSLYLNEKYSQYLIASIKFHNSYDLLDEETLELQSEMRYSACFYQKQDEYSNETNRILHELSYDNKEALEILLDESYHLSYIYFEKNYYYELDGEKIPIITFFTEKLDKKYFSKEDLLYLVSPVYHKSNKVYLYDVIVEDILWAFDDKLIKNSFEYIVNN